MEESEIEQMQHKASEAEAMLKMLANTNRLMILCSLLDGEKSVSQLGESIALSQSALSQHLAKLREQQLVSNEKRGQQIFYRITSTKARAILSTLALIYCR